MRGVSANLHGKSIALASSLVLCFTLALLLFAPAVARGQEVTASISGTITDPSNAPVPNAKVTAKDLDRGSTWTTQSNGQGFYNFPRVPVGRYEVRAENEGFQASVQSNIGLEMNQAARINIQLKLGDVTQTVDVESAPPLLQTDTTQLSTVLTSRTNEQLPLATRNYVQLTLLAPGSAHPNPSTFKSGQTTGGGGGRPYINGNREQSNNFLLDGVDNNQVSDNLIGYSPSVDAIQEFNMISQNASAEFGNFQGGIVSASIKSGTNEFHGSVFEFFRNDVLNANEWSNNWNGLPKNKLRWNQFGGAIGGPIKKDKLFFFADYQGQRFSNPATAENVTVFTAAERQGDFSRLLTEQGIQLRNPRDGSLYPNNQIPLNQMDAAVRNLFNSPLYPMPLNNNLQNNQVDFVSSQINGNQGDIKVDYNLSEKDRLFGRYSRSMVDNPSTHSFPLIADGFANYPTHSGVLNWTHTISPSIVNEARVGVNYVTVHNGADMTKMGDIAQQLGIPGVNERGEGLLALNFTNNNLVSNFGNLNAEQMFANTVIQYQDTMIITKGRHVFHAGFQGMRRRINTFYAGNNGSIGLMEFDGRFTRSAESDFFLGMPTRIGRGVNTGTWGQRNNIFSAYVQDDWRVSSTLTLNLGLRYELNTPWVEVNDRQVNFAPFTGAIQQAGGDTIYNNNRGLYNQYNGALNFQPRFGFAWTPGGKNTVIRGAYTISSYMEGTGTNLRLPLNPPLNQEFDTRYDQGQTLPGSFISNGLTVLSAAGDPFAGTTIRLWDPNVRPAVSKQWNFSVQHQFGNSTTLQVGYVGQHGTHLMVPMPYLQSQLLPDGTVARSPYLSGNPALANIGQISGTESNGSQRYDALQTTLQRRLADGLQFQVAYTYSKCMANAIGYYGSDGQSASQSAYWQNLYDKGAEWGPCFFDQTHSGTSYVTYELPFGRDKKFGKDLNRVLNAVAGDWQVSGILSLHTGFPMTVQSGDFSGTKSRGARANCLAPAEVFGRQNSPAGGYQWFDPTAFGQPSPGTFGNCGVGTVRGPGLATFDMSAQKIFPFTETVRLQFRGEFINLTNTPILNAPNRALGPQLGQLRVSQGARNIQFGLKLYF